MEIIVERRYISVMSADEFAKVYNDGFDFPGYYCQACSAWHHWNGWDGQPGPSHCLSEAELRQLEELIANGTYDTSRAMPREALAPPQNT